MQKHSPFDSLTAEVRIAEKSPDPNQLVTSDHTDLAVRRSWQRCMANYGLEPHHTPPPSVLTQSELKDILARSDELISFASFEIDRLFAHIGPSDYVVMLTDMRGVTVDFRCTPPLRGNARKAGLYLGSIWSESEQGTNGVGTCVFETRPLSIVRGEHFAARNAALDLYGRADPSRRRTGWPAFWTFHGADHESRRPGDHAPDGGGRGPAHREQLLRPPARGAFDGTPVALS